MSELPLRKRAVLVVEDQFLIADEMRRAIAALGGRTLGPCPSIAAARRLLEHETPDMAVVDINLQGDEVYPLVDDLLAREIPLAFATGYEDWAIPEAYRNIERLQKPVAAAALRKAAGKLLS